MAEHYEEFEVSARDALGPCVVSKENRTCPGDGDRGDGTAREARTERKAIVGRRVGYDKRDRPAGCGSQYLRGLRQQLGRFNAPGSFPYHLPGPHPDECPLLGAVS